MKDRTGARIMSRQTLLWLCMFAAAMILLIWKCPYGFGGDDEGFYLTVAHRLTLGDRLFADEWHLSQLSSFLLYPFVVFYRYLRGSTDGIMLCSRYMYVVLHGGVSILVYLRLKKFGFSAALGSIFFLLYAPLGMMTLSYNTLALDMLAISGVLLASSHESSYNSLVFSGEAFAFAVVCCPYLAAGYLLWPPALIVGAALKKRGLEDKSGLLRRGTFLHFTEGVLVVFGLFLVFFFRHSSVKDVINNLPGMFSDPEHPSQSFVYMIKHYVYCLVTAHRLMRLPLGAYAFLCAAIVFDKGREKRALLYLLLSAVSALAIWLMFLPNLTEDYYNSFIFPLVLPGFAAWLLLKDKHWRLFIGIFALGLLYSFCVCSTSNMGFIVLSMAFSLVNIASLIFIALCLKENVGASRIYLLARWSCTLCAAMLCALLIFVKADFCFWDASPRHLDSKIEMGPAKGIITSPSFKLSYEQLCTELEYYKDRPADDILVYTQSAWTYLILDDFPYASFSAWLSGLDGNTENRLALYYSMNPDKYPRYICVPKETAFGQLNYSREDIMASAQNYGFSFEERESCYMLEKSED